jgi:hypothetical protein
MSKWSPDDPRLKHGHNVGGKQTSTYTAWRSIRAHCYCVTHKQYADYGGRGITVCLEWDTFEQFLADMGEAPKGMSIDRRDNNRGYSKGNCRWATPTEQSQNRRSNRLIAFNNEVHCLAEWARRFGISRELLRWRLEHGRTIEQALVPPWGVA